MQKAKVVWQNLSDSGLIRTSAAEITLVALGVGVLSGLLANSGGVLFGP